MLQTVASHLPEDENVSTVIHLSNSLLKLLAGLLLRKSVSYANQMLLLAGYDEQLAMKLRIFGGLSLTTITNG